MLLHHRTLQDKTIWIEPMVDKDFPRHGAFMKEMVGGKTIFCASKKDQQECIDYARQRGYVIPFGF
jgi:hypothetical protein